MINYEDFDRTEPPSGKIEYKISKSYSKIIGKVIVN